MEEDPFPGRGAEKDGADLRAPLNPRVRVRIYCHAFELIQKTEVLEQLH
jgi:hypothetical protein